MFIIIAASSLTAISIWSISIFTICTDRIKFFSSPQISVWMTSSGVLLTSSGIPIALLGNPFTVFQLGYWQIQLVFTENRAWAIESGWTWSGRTTTSKDTWTEIWGDWAEATVKDDPAIVIKIFLKIKIVKILKAIV